MKQINASLILNDMKLKQQLMVWMIITLTVFVIVMSPIIIFRHDIINASIEAVMLLLFIGIPFGYRWGIKKVFIVLKLINSINHNEFIVERKKIVDKKQYKEDETYYKVFFENVDDTEKEGVVVDRLIYSNTNIGDEYLLIYEKKNKNFLKMYSTKEYYL